MKHTMPQCNVEPLSPPSPHPPPALWGEGWGGVGAAKVYLSLGRGGEVVVRGNQRDKATTQLKEWYEGGGWGFRQTSGFMCLKRFLPRGQWHAQPLCLRCSFVHFAGGVYTDTLSPMIWLSDEVSEHLERTTRHYFCTYHQRVGRTVRCAGMLFVKDDAANGSQAKL